MLSGSSMMSFRPSKHLVMLMRREEGEDWGVGELRGELLDVDMCDVNCLMMASVQSMLLIQNSLPN